MGVALVYDDGYDLRLGPHVFPSQKYRLVRDKLLPADFTRPAPATDDDMLLVHDPAWIEKLRQCELTPEELLRLEIPWSPATREAFWLCTGGTIEAARLALTSGIAFNIGGGFHHAFADHGEGFCAVNDIAVAIRRLQREALITRAMVVDCDVHHGNGTAAIFGGDRSVFTISLHQYNNYPAEKPPSTIDVNLRDGTGDDEYLARLRGALEFSLSGFAPELIVYVAGADPYEHDQLGGLALTMNGLRERDATVFGAARRRGISVAVVLAGGYARDVDDTVAIHCATVAAARDTLGNT